MLIPEPLVKPLAGHLDDLLSAKWRSRTRESQIHCALVSGLPVALTGTDGGVGITYLSGRPHGHCHFRARPSPGAD